MKRRVLFVGRTRYSLPLNPSLRRKWDALAETLEVRVLATGVGSDEMFSLVPPLRLGRLEGVAFYLGLPFRVAREIRRFRPDAIVAQSAYEGLLVLLGRALSGSRPGVIVEVHGDWRTLTRLYGSPLRRLFAPVGDRIGIAAVRRADALRTISPYTTGLVREQGREPDAVFATYTDLEAFVETDPLPLPAAPRALFIGVLERYKNVEGLAEAWRLAARELPDATLHVVGVGTQTAIVERLLEDLPAQTTWSPRLTTEQVIAALDEATVLLLPSRSEGLGRVVIEAFCRGRPVIGSRVGGIPDLVEHGVNGLLVEPGDVRGLADAIVSLLGDPGLVERLAVVGRSTAEAWLVAPEEFADRTRELVELAAPRPDRGDGLPRVLFVGRTRYALPLSASLARKWDALRAVMHVRVLASGRGADETFSLIRPIRPRRLEGAAFYATLPVRVAREVRRFEPDAIVAQSAYEGLLALIGRGLSRRKPAVVVEVHGDWRTLTRLYGSPLRRVFAPFGDRIGEAAVRRADALRTISPYTTSLVREQGREPDAVFATYTDLEAFVEAPPVPLPAEPRLLFVGALERSKNPEVLAEAWRRVAPRLPGATLHVVGSGIQAEVVERLRAELPGQVEWDRQIPTAGVIAALDRATALVLPSSSEGLGRVIIEAFCRGRPVIGTRVGGILDLVEQRANGLLVDVGDVDGLADAIVELLSDRRLAERLAAGSAASAEAWLVGPEEFAERTRELIERIAPPA